MPFFNLKIMNLRLLLSSIFLILTLTSTVANANHDQWGCVKDASGKIITLDAPGDVNHALVRNEDGGSLERSCNEDPLETWIKIYKIGLCKQDTSHNDLSSCQFIVNSTEGIEHTIKKFTSSPINTDILTIKPGSYDYVAVVISNKFGSKISFETTNTIESGNPYTGYNLGKYCWSSLPGPTTINNNDTLFLDHAQAVVGADAFLMECNTSPGTPQWTYEILNDLSRESDWKLGMCHHPDTNANQTDAEGDRQDYGFIKNGNFFVNLLKMDNSFATACENSAKLLMTTALDETFSVTNKTLYQLNFQQDNINFIEFLSREDEAAYPDPFLWKIGIDIPKLYLSVSEP